MSLIRLPFILAAVLGQIKTLSNPNPHVSPKISYSKWDIIVGQPLGLLMSNSLHALAASAEAAVIIATRYPSLPYAQRILSALVVHGDPAALRMTPLFLLASILSAGAGLLRWRCYRAMGPMFTFKSSIRSDHRLVTHGPYSVVRHPGYTGVVMMDAGSALWHFGNGSWVRECGVLSTTVGKVLVFCQIARLMVALFGLLARMPAEDAALEKRFGQEWVTWAEKVPYRLVPGLL